MKYVYALGTAFDNYSLEWNESLIQVQQDLSNFTIEAQQSLVIRRKEKDDEGEGEIIILAPFYSFNKLSPSEIDERLSKIKATIIPQ